MAEPITGLWTRAYSVPYTGAAKWGTGINPIHQFYGSAPLRVYGRNNEMPAVHAPATAPEDLIETAAPWGYQPEDIAGLDVFALSNPEANWQGIPFDPDGWPDYEQTTGTTRAEPDPREIYPVGAPQGAAEYVRSLRYGPRDTDNRVSNEVPTETVSEGWVNKPASGMNQGESGDNVIVADPSQYEVQTSMTQRFKTQNNDRATLRGTDETREPINSRVAPMKLKLYSGQQRHYDMFPQQMDDIPRPFHYRTAGTGRDLEMLPNEMVVITPLQRTPPPDPSLGTQDITLNQGGGESFGYTYEDGGWY
jgi:hypothetical protein